MVAKYRKKPVVIEAFQMTRERRTNNVEWPEWMHRAWNEGRGAPGSLYPTEAGTGTGTLSIATLEGEHLVAWGDWIIQGVQGELYPCKPDVFAKTYDKASEKMMAGRRVEKLYEEMRRVIDLGARSLSIGEYEELCNFIQDDIAHRIECT